MAIMSDEKSIYWMAQIVGWFLFVLLILFQNMLTGPVDFGIWIFLFLNFAVGLTLSHLMRIAILRFGLLRMKISQVLPRVIFLSILTGVLATLIIALSQVLIYQSDSSGFLRSPMVLVELIIPFTMVFLIWNVLYFAAIYLKNYEREEVKNLRLTASVTEAELRNLRAQLNPHFMFNALNSIRALIDEDPVKAKMSITQMSNILRSSLTSGRRKFVALEEEMKVVRDYMALEKVRFEERINFSFSIPEHLHKVHIPPLLVQTLVENAVKHGISRLPDGGKIRIEVSEIPEGIIELKVINTGTYLPTEPQRVDSTGIGLANSKRRLNLLYGKDSDISITNKDNQVICRVIFPIKTDKNLDNENADY